MSDRFFVRRAWDFTLECLVNHPELDAVTRAHIIDRFQIEEWNALFVKPASYQRLSAPKLNAALDWSEVVDPEEAKAVALYRSPHHYHEIPPVFIEVSYSLLCYRLRLIDM